MKLRYLIPSFVLILASRAIFAAEPLTLSDLLDGVNARFPLIEGARRDADAAKAEVRSSEGAFDIQWKTRAAALTLGYYDNQRIDSVLEQPTTLWGTTFFGGYRLGLGKFPIYDGKQQTNPGGELRLGLNVPLWRDGPTDRRRANIEKARLGVELADKQLTQQKIETIRAATHRYWDWVVAGKKVAIFRTLLKIAEERDSGLASRVRHGDLPEFERKDNERAILQRRSQLVAAERSFQQAKIELSMYFRSSNDEPILANEDQLPPIIPEPVQTEIPDSDITKAITNRPDLARFAALKSQNEVERILAFNQTRPKIDLQAQGVRSLRDGDPTRNGTQLEVGFTIEIPLQANTASGREDSSFATISRLELQERFLRDRVGADVSDAKSAVDAALERIKLIKKEVEITRNLELAERDRFKHGDSNLLFVNLREQATVDAEVRELEVMGDFRKSLGTLKAALGLI